MSKTPRNHLEVVAGGRLVFVEMGLVPFVPLLLLPFILIFFVIIFPLWGAALGVLGLLLLLARGCDWILAKAGVKALGGAVAGLRRAFRWVLTFGGFTERVTGPRESAK